MTVPRRRLGASGFEVSVVALGSWRTFERLPRERGVEVLRHARERGIGATSPAQLDETLAGPALHAELSEADRARLRAVLG